MTANDNPPPGGKRRSSQKRQRNHAVKIALTDGELAEVQDRAQSCGLSRSSYGRAAMLGSPGPRAQRTPPVNAVVLAKATAALNKGGSVVNQIAHRINAGGSVTLANACFAALAEMRAAAAAIRQNVGRKDRT
jgi:hypothetical protein